MNIKIISTIRKWFLIESFSNLHSLQKFLDYHVAVYADSNKYRDTFVNISTGSGLNLY